MRLLALAAAGALTIAGCGASSEPEDLAYATGEQSDHGADPTETETDREAGETADDRAAAALAQALDRLGSDYRFASSLTTAGGGHITIDGYRVDQAMTFELTVDDLTVETVARDGLLWTRPVGVDEWSSTTWNKDHDPIAPLRNPMRVSSNGVSGLIATYQGADLGLGTNRAIEVAVAFGDEAIWFSTTADGIRLESVLTATAELPAIVTPT